MNESHRDSHRRSQHRDHSVFRLKDLVVFVWMVVMFGGMMYGIGRLQREVRDARSEIVRLQSRLLKADPNWNIQAQLDSIEKNTRSLQAEMNRVRQRLEDMGPATDLKIN